LATPPTSGKSARLAGLLAKIALGDQAAFGEFYGVTSPHLYGVALRILRSPPIAEEILQEAYVTVWHHAGSYEAAKSQPLTWLTSIVRNRDCRHWPKLHRRSTHRRAYGASSR
jgi:RNA polymerase sigma-70 factor (ECF subfamily)